MRCGSVRDASYSMRTTRSSALAAVKVTASVSPEEVAHGEHVVVGPHARHREGQLFHRPLLVK